MSDRCFHLASNSIDFRGILLITQGTITAVTEISLHLELHVVGDMIKVLIDYIVFP